MTHILSLSFRLLYLPVGPLKFLDLLIKQLGWTVQFFSAGTVRQNDYPKIGSEQISERNFTGTMTKKVVFYKVHSYTHKKQTLLLFWLIEI